MDLATRQRTGAYRFAYPPYSPDMAPRDFFVFPKLKRILEARRFSTMDEIKTRPKEALHQCFSNGKLRWHKCRTSQGDDFEGDGIKIEESANTF